MRKVLSIILFMFMSVAMFAAAGGGTAVINPVVAAPNQQHIIVSLTYTGDGSLWQDGVFELSIPIGWSPPSLTPSNAGYIRVVPIGVSLVSPLTINGNCVTITTTNASTALSYLYIYYGDRSSGGPGATASSGGAGTFKVATNPDAVFPVVDIATQPVINVATMTATATISATVTVTSTITPTYTITPIPTIDMRVNKASATNFTISWNDILMDYRVFIGNKIFNPYPTYIKSNGRVIYTAALPKPEDRYNVWVASFLNGSTRTASNNITITARPEGMTYREFLTTYDRIDSCPINTAMSAGTLVTQTVNTMADTYITEIYSDGDAVYAVMEDSNTKTFVASPSISLPSSIKIKQNSLLSIYCVDKVANWFTYRSFLVY